MNTNNWGQLLKKQDQFVHQEQLQNKTRSLYLKQLYKQQLQKMISQQKLRSRNFIQGDKIILQQQQQTELLKDLKQKQKQHHLQFLKNQFSKQNLTQTIKKKKQEQQEIEREKQIMHQKYQKIQTEMSEEKYNKLKKRELEKLKLAQAYNEQLTLQDLKRNIQKQQDRKYSEISYRLSIEQQIQRLKHMNKIRFGYRQNPQTLIVAQQIQRKKNQDKNAFLKRMEQQNQRTKVMEARRKLEDEQKIRRVQETSQFNRGMFEDKAFKKRHQSLQQVLMEHQKWETIQQELQKQQFEKQKAKHQNRKKLKEDLQRQITQANQSRFRLQLMNPKQVNINKQILKGGNSILPGLSQDYSIKRQFQILQRFLK